VNNLEKKLVAIMETKSVEFEKGTKSLNVIYMKHNHQKITCYFTSSNDGFGGLVVRMLASGSRVRGFKHGRSRWIFLYIKILSMPSFGGEVK
jgi:hypothetical protein